jgi:hypothetical protein
VFELPRIYAANGQRALRIDYRHLIGTLIKKPQAFRYSQLRDSILPSPDYQQIWQYSDESLPAHLRDPLIFVAKQYNNWL